MAVLLVILLALGLQHPAPLHVHATWALAAAAELLIAARETSAENN